MFNKSIPPDVLFAYWIFGNLADAHRSGFFVILLMKIEQNARLHKLKIRFAMNVCVMVVHMIKSEAKKET